jgi:hypothetical protein
MNDAVKEQFLGTLQMSGTRTDLNDMNTLFGAAARNAALIAEFRVLQKFGHRVRLEPRPYSAKHSDVWVDVHVSLDVIQEPWVCTNLEEHGEYEHHPIDVPGGVTACPECNRDVDDQLELDRRLSLATLGAEDEA